MRKLLLAGLVAGSLIAGAGIARADSRSGSSESDQHTYPCPTTESPLPEGQPAPGPGECEAGDTEYTHTEHTNDVDCTDEPTVPAQEGIAVSVNGDPDEQWLEIEACSDGTAPVQGRGIIAGSVEEEGIHGTADGDKDNSPEQAQGWATVGAGTGGPSVTCGDDAGTQDSTESTDADGQDDCG
jgi:hypothetical protein